MTVLADFILLGHEVVGSFALSSDKTDLFAVALGTYLDGIQEVINRFAVPRLWILNGMDPTTCPKVQHGDISTPDLGVLGAYVLALVQAGMPMFPDEQLENHLRQVAHLPEITGQPDQIPEMIPGVTEYPMNPEDTAKPVATPAGQGGGTGAQQGAAKGLKVAAARANRPSGPTQPSPNGSGINP
jgi:hypothetical protein